MRSCRVLSNAIQKTQVFWRHCHRNFFSSRRAKKSISHRITRKRWKTTIRIGIRRSFGWAHRPSYAISWLTPGLAGFGLGRTAVPINSSVSSALKRKTDSIQSSRALLFVPMRSSTSSMAQGRAKVLSALIQFRLAPTMKSKLTASRSSLRRSTMALNPIG